MYLSVDYFADQESSITYCSLAVDLQTAVWILFYHLIKDLIKDIMKKIDSLSKQWI